MTHKLIAVACALLIAGCATRDDSWTDAAGNITPYGHAEIEKARARANSYDSVEQIDDIFIRTTGATIMGPGYGWLP
jgi:hypothetical protein